MDMDTTSPWYAEGKGFLLYVWEREREHIRAAGRAQNTQRKQETEQGQHTGPGHERSRSRVERTQRKEDRGRAERRRGGRPRARLSEIAGL